MTGLDILQAIGLIFGVGGALVVTSQYPCYRAIGFGFWLIGNGAWVTYALQTDSIYLRLQFGVFFTLAALGVVTNAARYLEEREEDAKGTILSKP